jgi:DNA polymerase-3 subunit alpha
MFLIFDTETTGLPRSYNAPLTDSDNWPRIVQIAWQLHDYSGNLINQQSIIVKPDGFTIPFNSIQVHGITNERAHEEGEDLRTAIETFSKIIEQCTYVCGHNIEFDLNIVGAELIRLGLNDIFSKKQIIDTKNDQTTEYCAIPGGKGGKFKWPSLTELYQKLFNASFDEAHNAPFDVEATTKVFFEIIKRNIIRVDEIPTSNLSSINYVAPDLSQLYQHEQNWKKRNNSKSIDEPITTSANVIIADEEINFSHLHNHTQFSVQQSTSDIDDLVKKAAEYNCPAVALTDYGNMYGAFLFWQAVDKANKGIKAHNDSIEKGEKQGNKKNELKAIIGCELYVCKNHEDRSKQDNGYTQVFLAKNKKGYQNLSKLSSIGFTKGFYYVPRIDKKVLENHADGLIATTGSLNAEIPNLILNVGEEQAEEAFKYWHQLFGEDFYVELNRHNLPDENHVNEVLLRFAKKYGVKYFAANDNFYIDKSGANAHDILLCVKEGEIQETPIGRGRGFRYGLPNHEFYFRSPAEMVKLFSDLPEAISTTNEIVSKVEAYKLGRDVLLPAFEIDAQFIADHNQEIIDSFERLVSYRESNWNEKNVPEADREQAKLEIRKIAEQFIFLKDWTYRGMHKRYPEITPDIKERIDFELQTIERMGYPGYFLIVADFIAKAREMNVSVGPGRGSAAGSAIAYCLWITNVDPIKYDLLFERFLNPDRISMPDIDIDFDDEGREKVINYVINKYGASQVAQIITYGTMGGKSAIRDTSRVLNLPLSDADRLAKSFPGSPAASLKGLLKADGIDKKYLEEIKERREWVEQSHSFRKISEENSLQSDVLKKAYELEGCVRNTGIHACGIIITPDEMSKFVPVTRAKEGDMLVTQFDNSVAESAGLLKMDFLGLRTLTIIKDALRHIKARHGLEIDIDAIPLDDKKTFELFQRGETNGVFQFESDGMQKALKELKPDALTDLIAMNALYRPGPLAYIPNYIKRKHGIEPIVYELEGMDEFLKETYGITVYQEQVMRLSQKLANFTKGDADVLRKAMGKKQKDVLDKMKSKFLEGCKSNGHDLTVAEKVWTDWEAFASYAFNKSHSTCYAYVAFQTAYLKANYPAEFMASVLTHNMGNIESVTFFMEECKRMGIKVLGPDVNESLADFSVNEQGEIRFGMAAIKGVGSNVVDAVVENRNNQGKFISVFEMARRLDTKAINKKSLEALSQAGAFDSFEGMHRAMFFKPDLKDGSTLTEKIIKYGNSMNNMNETSQVNMFGDAEELEISEPPLPNVESWAILEQLAKEKEVVGFYISGHPLDSFKRVIKSKCKNTTADLSDLKPLLNKEITLAGIITIVENRTSKTGNPWGKFTLEDFNGTSEFNLFGNDYVNFRNYLDVNQFVYIKGKVQPRFNQPENLEFKIQKIELLSELKNKAFNHLQLTMKLNDLDETTIIKLEGLLKSQKTGNCTFDFIINDPSENQSIKLEPKAGKISVSDELLEELEKLPYLEVSCM